MSGPTRVRPRGWCGAILGMRTTEMLLITLNRRLRWLLVTLVATLALAAPAQAQADEGGGDNNATAVNTQDGSSELDVDFDVTAVFNGIVDNTNTAEAYASCESCQSMAIAIQVVLVVGGVDVVTPHNIATAINDDCTACTTVALAYQLVLGVPDGMRLSRDATVRLAMIALAFRRLEREGGTPSEVIAETNRLLHELTDTLANGFVPIHRPRDDEDSAAPGDDDPEATATPSASPDGGESPTPTEAADPAEPTETPPAATETPTPEPSASPEPSATAEPSPSATP